MNRRRNFIVACFLNLKHLFDNQINLISYYLGTSSDICSVFPNQRESVPRVENYSEIIIPRYSLDDYRSHFRLSRSSFESLSHLLHKSATLNKSRGPNMDIDKATHMFLWYLGNLESFRSMSDRFCVSKSTLHVTVKWVASAIVADVLPLTVQWPRGDTVDAISCQFSEITPFQNVIGALDTTHISIKAPVEHPNAYYNPKKFHSVILLAACNANLEFTYVWTGNPGSTHDATVLRYSELFHKHEELIPEGYYLLADTAFPLLGWLITPFRNYGNLRNDQKLFNKYLSKARQVIERAFGLLKCRFRRLLRFEAVDLNLIVESILSASVLHNLCIREGEELFEDQDFIGIEIEDANNNANARGHDMLGVRLRQSLVDQVRQLN